MLRIRIMYKEECSTYTAWLARLHNVPRAIKVPACPLSDILIMLCSLVVTGFTPSSSFFCEWMVIPRYCKLNLSNTNYKERKLSFVKYFFHEPYTILSYYITCKYV